jgi:peptidylprolyl isomerase
MKTLPIALLALAASALSAQTPAPTPHAPVHHTAAPVHHEACAKLPEMSAKIPALPAGDTCVKTLYTLSTIPNIKLEDVSPLEAKDLADKLGIESSKFSLQYVDTKIGAGPLAEPHKWYTINYTGYLLDGTKFDSSLDRNEPISIPYGGHQVIPGWDTGFDGMHVGGKRRLFIPYQLAYGAQAKGPIPARSELIFDVELLAQSDAKPEPKPAAPAAPAAPAPGAHQETKPTPGTPGANLTVPPAKPSTAPAATPAGAPKAPPAPTATPGAAPGSNPTVQPHTTSPAVTQPQTTTQPK